MTLQEKYDALLESYTTALSMVEVQITHGLDAEDIKKELRHIVRDYEAELDEIRYSDASPDFEGPKVFGGPIPSTPYMSR